MRPPLAPMKIGPVARSPMYRSRGTAGPGSERDNGVLAALPEDLDGAVTPFELDVVDVATQGLGDAKAVEGE